jgi:3-hydroxyisobutyrate dehydrogenase
MPNTPTVAVLGLGSMGHAFAANLLKKGFPTRVWNRSSERADDLAREGAAVGGSPREAAEGADAVISMLPDGEVTASVLLGEEGGVAGLRRDGVLAQMGTVGVEATQRLVEAVRAQRPDVTYVDAPVSGTKAPAEQGQVVVLASGDRAAAETVVGPVFAALGKATHWLGEAGAGSRMKLVVNAWLAAVVQGVAESALLAGRLGFAPDDVWRVLEGGPLAAPFVKLKLAAIAEGDFAPQFALDLALKDCRLALRATDGQPLPILEKIAEVWGEAVAAGLGKGDVEGIHRYLAGG